MDQEIREELSTAQRLHSKCEGSTQRRQGLLKLAGYHLDLQPVGYVCWTLDECGKGDQKLPGLLTGTCWACTGRNSITTTNARRCFSSYR